MKIKPVQITKDSWSLLLKLFVPIFGISLIFAGSEALVVIAEKNIPLQVIMHLITFALSIIFIGYIITLVTRKFPEIRTNFTGQKFLRLIGVYFLIGFAMLLAAIPAGLFVLFSVNTDSTLFSIIGAILGFISIFLPLYLLIRWFCLYPAVVIGHEGLFSSFKKSWDLTKKSFWRIVATAMLVIFSVIIITVALFGLVAALLSFLPDSIIEHPVSLWLLLALYITIMSPTIIAQALLYIELDKKETTLS